MMRFRLVVTLSSWLAVALFASANCKADDSKIWGHFASPDQKLEASVVPEGQDRDVYGHLFDYGAKVFVRAKGSSAQGILLAENSRWIKVKWSPDSRYLAVFYGWDGHSTNTSVFAIDKERASGQVTAQLRDLTPNRQAYDTKWSFERWDLKHHSIILTKEYKPHGTGGDYTTTKHIHVVIGSKVLPVSEFPLPRR